PGPDACRVVVADTGVGIAPEDLPRVFERFYQGRRGQSPSTPGTGIGLALSHELVALHGGEIAVASTPGEGSTFEVALPILDFGLRRCRYDWSSLRPPRHGSPGRWSGNARGPSPRIHNPKFRIQNSPVGSYHRARRRRPPGHPRVRPPPPRTRLRRAR